MIAAVTAIGAKRDGRASGGEVRGVGRGVARLAEADGETGFHLAAVWGGAAVVAMVGLQGQPVIGRCFALQYPR